MGNRMYRELHQTMKSGDLGWEVMRSKVQSMPTGKQNEQTKSDEWTTRVSETERIRSVYRTHMG